MMDGDAFDQTTGEVIAPSRNGMPAEIAKAVIGVMRAVRTLGTDTRNEHARYNYVSIDKFLEAIGPKLAEHGLIITQDEIAAEIRAGAPDEQGRVRSALYVRYAFGLVHESGAGWGPVYRSVALPATGPQSFGSAESYMMKRFMRSLFMVPTGEKDADEEAATEMPSTGRTGARTAHEAPRAARSTPQRPQAAPAPSAAKAEATKQYKELRDAIDNAVDLADLDGWDGSPAWKRCAEMIAEAEGDPARAVNAMQALRDRIEGQRQFLLGST